jgi:hypothetical protein
MTSRQNETESVKLFIEYKAFLLSHAFRLILFHPLPPSPVSNLSLFLSLPVCRRSSLLMGEGGLGAESFLLLIPSFSSSILTPPPSSSLPHPPFLSVSALLSLSFYLLLFVSQHSSSFLLICLSSVFPFKSPFFSFFPPGLVFVDLFGAQESIPSMTGLYDNPICRTGPAGCIGWRNRFLGIDSWAS